MQDVASRDTPLALLDLLRRRPRKAEFVSQIASALRRTQASQEDIEHALATLEADRSVIVHEGACADPHLAGTDLRIVALVESPGQGTPSEQDPVAEAVAHANSVWDRWLSEYLATHTCS